MKSILVNPNRSKKDLILLIFRVGISFVMISEHGFPKVQTLFGDGDIQFINLFGIGMVTSLILSALAEFVGSIFLIFGFMTRLGAFMLFCNMAVALLIAHGDVGFSVMGKQVDLILLLCYALLFVMGSGRFSLDKLIWKKG